MQDWRLTVAAVLLAVSGLVGTPLAVQAQAPERGSPVSSSDLGRAVAAYNDWVSGIETVTGGGKAVVGAPGEKDRSFKFSLVLARPGRVRLQGRLGNLTTLFDLAADLDGWTLFLPREHRVARSSQDDAAAGLLLPPRDLVAVALPLPVDPVRLREEGGASRDPRGLRLVLPPAVSGDPHRVLWIDPRSGVPRRLELRRGSQLETPALVAEFEDFRKAGEKRDYPRSIDVRTAEGAWARLTLDSVTLNRKVDDRRFSILVPPGTESIALEAIDSTFLPETGGVK